METKQGGHPMGPTMPSKEREKSGAQNIIGELKARVSRI